MSTISVSLPDPVLKSFEAFAQRQNRETSEVIREVLEAHAPTSSQVTASIRDFVPLRLGYVLKPLAADDDLLEEMLNA